MLDRRRLHILRFSFISGVGALVGEGLGCKSSLAAASCVAINGLFIICLTGKFVARSRVHHFTMQPVWTVNEGLHEANGALCRVSLSRRNYERRTFDRLKRACRNALQRLPTPTDAHFCQNNSRRLPPWMPLSQIYCCANPARRF